MEQLSTDQFAKGLRLVGVVVVFLGAMLTLRGRRPFTGQLPWDFHFKGKDFALCFPPASRRDRSPVSTFILRLLLRQ